MSRLSSLTASVVACAALSGGLISAGGAGVALADGSGSVFCLISNSMVNTSLPNVSAAVPTPAQAAATISSLGQLAGTLTAGAANAPSSKAVAAFTAAADKVSNVVNAEKLVAGDLARRSLVSAAVHQRAAATAVSAMLPALLAAKSYVWTSCPALVTSAALTKATVVSTVAITTAKASKRAVSAHDLTTAAAGAGGVVVTRNISPSNQVAQFTVTVGAGKAARVCVKEPTVIGGSAVAIGVC